MAGQNTELILMVGVLGVSASAVLARLSQVSSEVTTAYRLDWTVLLLSPVVLLRCCAELRRVTAWDLVLRGVSDVLLVLHFLTWFESLKRTSMASSTVLVSTKMIFTTLDSAPFLHGKIPRPGAWAILLAFGGSALLVLSGGGGTEGLSNNLLALAAVLAATVYTLIGRIQRSHLSTTVYASLIHLACFLTLLLGTAAAGTPLTGYGGREWFIGLALVVLCTFLGHSPFSWCLKYLSPSYVPTTRLCEPVFSSLATIPLFGEVPGPLQPTGGATVLGVVLLYT